MQSIDIKRCLLALSLALANCVVLASESPPRVLQDPLLGLRIPRISAKLDMFPNDLRDRCADLVANENWVGRLSIYAKVQGADKTYFVVGGYYERSQLSAPENRYSLDATGAVLVIQDGKCTTFGGGREVFEARDSSEIPQLEMRRMADDLLNRLSKAFGGEEKLRRELRNQRIDPEQLPLELRAAVKSFMRLQ